MPALVGEVVPTDLAFTSHQRFTAVRAGAATPRPAANLANRDRPITAQRYDQMLFQHSIASQRSMTRLAQSNHAETSRTKRPFE